MLLQFKADAKTKNYFQNEYFATIKSIYDTLLKEFQDKLANLREDETGDKMSQEILTQGNVNKVLPELV